MEIQVAAPREDASCAYCRARITPPSATCAACGVVAHEDCARELGGPCPTPGCAGRLGDGAHAAPAPRVETAKAELERAAARRRTGRWLVRLAVVAGLAVFGIRHRDHVRVLTMTPAAREQEAERCMEEGAALMRRGYSGEHELFGDARALFERAAVLHPGPRARYALEQVGHSLAAEGDTAGAIAAFDRIVERWPDRMLGYYGRARQRQRAGDIEGALADWQAALDAPDPDMRPGDIDDRYEGRAECRALLGDTRGALADYETYLSRWPIASDFIACARVRVARDDVVGAVSDLKRAMQIDPSTREDIERAAQAAPDSREAQVMRFALSQSPVGGPEVNPSR